MGLIASPVTGSVTVCFLLLKKWEVDDWSLPRIIIVYLLTPVRERKK